MRRAGHTLTFCHATLAVPRIAHQRMESGADLRVRRREDIDIRAGIPPCCSGTNSSR